MTVGEKITMLRESSGVLQKELAKAINVDPVVLNRIEKNKRPIRGDEVKAVADYFNVTADYLLGRNGGIRRQALSEEQENLIGTYNKLSKDNKRIVFSMMRAFVTQQAASVFGSVINGNNVKGSLFINNGDVYAM